MSISTQTRDQITSLLKRYQIAYNNHNIRALSELLAVDVVLHECWVEGIIIGRNNFLCEVWKDFDHYKKVCIRFVDVDIKSEGVIAWISASCILVCMGGRNIRFKIPCHFTAVVRGTGCGWEFAQIHTSFIHSYHL